MLAALRRPKWLIAGLVILALAALFIRLGIWQLDRFEERRLQNATGQSRFEAEPVDLKSLLAESQDLETIRYRRVVLRGTWDLSEEVLIRSQVHLGMAGFHVVTPLVIDDDLAVLVNRGWVPLNMDQPPVSAEPDRGEVEVEGWVQLTQTRPALGPEDPPGERTVLSRIDIGRIVEQTQHGLAPVYVVELGERGGDLPVPVQPPDFTDQGPHLGYAFQWFGFAVIVVVGFYFLLRRNGVSRDRPRD